MEDFSLKNNPKPQNVVVPPSIVPNEYGGIYDKPKKPRISFLQSRLNKDNFWNLVFFVLTVLGWKLAFFLNDKYLSFITAWSTILLVPYIVKKNSNITFDKEKLQFLNRNNEVLNDRAPNFFLLVILTIGLTAWVGLLSDGASRTSSFNIYSAIFGIIPVLVPTMYCILKNFPIAVYFKKETYIGDGTARSYSGSYSEHRKHNQFSRDISQINSPYNRMHNPINNYSAMNSYHRKH